MNKLRIKDIYCDITMHICLEFTDETTTIAEISYGHIPYTKLLLLKGTIVSNCQAIAKASNKELLNISFMPKEEYEAKRKEMSPDDTPYYDIRAIKGENGEDTAITINGVPLTLRQAKDDKTNG